MFDRGADAARRALGADAAAGYVCPLCLQPFSDIEQLSREHAPPQRVGGTVVALTCRDCNSEGGARIDHHLAAEADLASALDRDQDKEWSATVEVNGVPARAAVSFNEKGLVFTGHPHRNDPKTWGEHNEAWERLRDGGNVKFQIAFNYRQRVVEVGWLRAPTSSPSPLSATATSLSQRSMSCVGRSVSRASSCSSASIRSRATRGKATR